MIFIWNLHCINKSSQQLKMKKFAMNNEIVRMDSNDCEIVYGILFKPCNSA